jgi:two-component system CheB/CheR fusion protein
VDDSPDVADSEALLLRLWGYEARVAHSGPEALAEAEAFRPGVALVDLMMPGMDGYALARRLRALPGLEGLRLIAVTGLGSESYRRRSREAGFACHLLKPADPKILRRLLREPTGEGRCAGPENRQPGEAGGPLRN